MKILINYKSNNKFKKLNLILPSFILSNKILLNFIFKKITKNKDITSTEQIKEIFNCIKIIIKNTKKYTKEFGHFTIIEFSNNENNLKLII